MCCVLSVATVATTLAANHWYMKSTSCAFQWQRKHLTNDKASFKTDMVILASDRAQKNFVAELFCALLHSQQWKCGHQSCQELNNVSAHCSSSRPKREAERRLLRTPSGKTFQKRTHDKGHGHALHVRDDLRGSDTSECKWHVRGRTSIRAQQSFVAGTFVGCGLV